MNPQKLTKGAADLLTAGSIVDGAPTTGAASSASPLSKGRGGIVGRASAKAGSWAGVRHLSPPFPRRMTHRRLRWFVGELPWLGRHIIMVLDFSHDLHASSPAMQC